jgi:hypothetical protein
VHDSAARTLTSLQSDNIQNEKAGKDPDALRSVETPSVLHHGFLSSISYNGPLVAVGETGLI